MNILVAVFIIIFAYFYNNHYLDRKHARIIQQEGNGGKTSTENLIILKTLSAGILAILMLITLLILIQAFGKGKQVHTFQACLASCTITSINIFFTRNQKVLDHFHNVVRRTFDNFQFTAVYVVVKMWFRKKQISPGPLPRR